ncbi:hypothetical protein BFD37_14660 [Escherichia coli]|nr:hypothetical protein ECONIH1_22230 [Escherichia coli]EFO3097869.1 hypothetical protein [Escherichia coli O153]EFY0634416.1 hypothetical protein [Shigella flexneri]EWC55246.1 hypothetical protein G654_13866 [Escherichia coli EC096/10]OYJ38801.1 hypothetical protein CI736_21535 [Shigella boydii]OYL28342.1 hypothetical protein CI769_22255 [Shigella sonnei]
MPKTPRVYVAFCFYICNLNGVITNTSYVCLLRITRITWLFFAQGWWVQSRVSLLNKGLRGYTSANNFL